MPTYYYLTTMKPKLKIFAFVSFFFPHLMPKKGERKVQHSVSALTEQLFSPQRKVLWQFSLSFFPKFRMQTGLVVPTIKKVIPCCL